METLHCLVVDFGECYSKIGDGSDEAPRVVVPSLSSCNEFIEYSFNYDQIIPSTYAKRTDEFTMWASGARVDYYFGYEAYRRDNLIERKSFFLPGQQKSLKPGISEEVGHFFHNTMIDYFDSAENCHQAALILDKPDSSISAKKELASALFESHKFQKFLMVPDYVATLYSTGKSTGTVISCGYGTTYSASVMNGVPSPFGIAYSPFVGKSVEAEYQDILREILHRQKNPDYKWIGEVEARKFLEQNGICTFDDINLSSSQTKTNVKLPEYFCKLLFIIVQ